MNIVDWAVIGIAKSISWASKLLKFGAGATIPGEFVRLVRPNLFLSLLSQAKEVVIIAGTNGKTTTAKMLYTIVAKQGINVHRNQSGANLINGLIASLISNTTFFGKLKAPIQILEVDESALTQVLRLLNEKNNHFFEKQSEKSVILVLLNLFRDQLDRYGEVDSIITHWQKEMLLLPKHVYLVVNADDPHLAYLGMQLSTRTQYFGLDNPDLFLSSMQHATDSIYCPKCTSRLTFGGVYFSHLGKWACGRCGLTHPKVHVSSTDFESPIEGIYNVYNTLAAASVARILRIPDVNIHDGLSIFTPAFGRLEKVRYLGKKVTILLSKNPTGMNESIRTVLAAKQKGPVLFVLNDRVPDGQDVSWIWDVDLEQFVSYPYGVYVSGDRCFDMGLRLKYAEVPVINVELHLEKAIIDCVQSAKSDEEVWILPTYSAMLEVRKIVTGKKIL